MEITAGRIVNYRWAGEVQPDGANYTMPGDILPAVIVRVWNQDPGTCNLQVFVDGPGTVWVTSRTRGDNIGQWQWPTIKKEK
jgi:hypothetical protein